MGNKTFDFSSKKKGFFAQKKSKFGPKMALLFILGQALPVHLVGRCGARAVSRKTAIYFIAIILQCIKEKAENYFMHNEQVCVKYVTEFGTCIQFSNNRRKRKRKSFHDPNCELRNIQSNDHP